MSTETLPPLPNADDEAAPAHDFDAIDFSALSIEGLMKACPFFRGMTAEAATNMASVLMPDQYNMMQQAAPAETTQPTTEDRQLTQRSEINIFDRKPSNEKLFQAEAQDTAELLTDSRAQIEALQQTTVLQPEAARDLIDVEAHQTALEQRAEAITDDVEQIIAMQKAAAEPDVVPTPTPDNKITSVEPTPTPAPRNAHEAQPQPKRVSKPNTYLEQIVSNRQSATQAEAAPKVERKASAPAVSANKPARAAQQNKPAATKAIPKEQKNYAEMPNTDSDKKPSNESDVMHAVEFLTTLSDEVARVFEETENKEEKQAASSKQVGFYEFLETAAETEDEPESELKQAFQQVNQKEQTTPDVQKAITDLQLSLVQLDKAREQNPDAPLEITPEIIEALVTILEQAGIKEPAKVIRNFAASHDLEELIDFLKEEFPDYAKLSDFQHYYLRVLQKRLDDADDRLSELVRYGKHVVHAATELANQAA